MNTSANQIDNITAEAVRRNIVFNLIQSEKDLSKKQILKSVVEINKVIKKTLGILHEKHIIWLLNKIAQKYSSELKILLRGNKNKLKTYIKSLCEIHITDKDDDKDEMYVDKKEEFFCTSGAKSELHYE